jgi:hypothetical protein
LRPSTKNELIIEAWERLDCESVGATELEQIQAAIRERLGEGAVDSPAAIARLLADEGARLRHPEVLQFDTAWRRQTGFGRWDQLDFSSLSGAASAIAKMEAFRKEFEESHNEVELRRIAQFVVDLKQELSLISRRQTTSRQAQTEAKEIMEWLSVWHSSPNLFADWLDLRVNSREFSDLFPDFVIPK